MNPPDLSRLKALFEEREARREEAKQKRDDESMSRFYRADGLFVSEAIRIAEGL